jgi:hypothetical protein
MYMVFIIQILKLVKWIKYTDTEVSEAGNVIVMLKDKQNLQKRLNAFLYWRWALLALEANKMQASGPVDAEAQEK